MNALHVESEDLTARVVVRQLHFLQVYSRGSSAHISEKQAPTQRFRDVVAMESIARVRDLKVMPASFAAAASWISCRLCVVDFDV